MRALPFAPLDTIAPDASLILAPHPDDESLGCGGLIAALSEAGRPPLVVCVTDGSASHPGSRTHPPARLKTLREAELCAACAELGVPAQNVHFLGLTDAKAPIDGPVAAGRRRRNRRPRQDARGHHDLCHLPARPPL